MNPGPVAYVRLGFLNARSIVRKSAFIHNIILSNTLSILAIQETRISNLDPLNVIQDAAPDSFTVLHALVLCLSLERGVGDWLLWPTNHSQ